MAGMCRGFKPLLLSPLHLFPFLDVSADVIISFPPIFYSQKMKSSRSKTYLCLVEFISFLLPDISKKRELIFFPASLASTLHLLVLVSFLSLLSFRSVDVAGNICIMAVGKREKKKQQLLGKKKKGKGERRVPPLFPLITETSF